ncbi:MAG: hypothetical protein JNJ73_14115 [Hyphomonadaceae bacterium]|nr:hypothetical protein [Hyphomonadaceae bacterium]
MRAVAAILAACLAVWPQAAAAQGVPSPWVEQVVARLAHIERLLARDGYRRVQGPFSGPLARDGVQLFDITLRGGGDYRIVAVCDSDCRDLDMRLYDQAGTLIAENLDASDVAIVASQPRWTGPFSVEIIMAQCAAAPCYYAAYVYAR